MALQMATYQLRAVLGKRINAAHYGGEMTVITHNQERRAFLAPSAWLTELLAAHREGRPVNLSAAAWAELEQAVAGPADPEASEAEVPHQRAA